MRKRSNKYAKLLLMELHNALRCITRPQCSLTVLASSTGNNAKTRARYFLLARRFHARNIHDGRTAKPEQNPLGDSSGNQFPRETIKRLAGGAEHSEERTFFF